MILLYHLCLLEEITILFDQSDRFFDIFITGITIRIHRHSRHVRHSSLGYDTSAINRHLLIV